jgi:hypothetical protein
MKFVRENSLGRTPHVPDVGKAPSWRNTPTDSPAESVVIPSGRRNRHSFIRGFYNGKTVYEGILLLV